jgi:aerobic-type carbon monoxide dehydrogenase small subunit (CoxS/CutS family)
MSSFTLLINGTRQQVIADPEMPLLWALRDLLHLTGTKYGCGMGVCGACTVHQDGNAVRSCQIQLSETVGKNFTTIEGLSVASDHPCQKAWMEQDVSQCGYCQAGMIMETAALLRRKPAVDDEEIDVTLSGHVCRCGTYQRIRRAIHEASRQVRGT